MKPTTIIDDQGVPRILNTLMPDASEPIAYATGAGMIPDIPRNQWEEIDLSDWCPPIMNQGSTPQCGGFSTAAAHTAAVAMSGRPLDAPLSPGWIYGYTKRPGGGILVRDALTCLRDRGCCSITTVGEFDINPSDYSSAARKEAEQYKLTAAFTLTSFDQMVSALLAGYMVEFGCLIGNAFRPDPQGVVPDQSGLTGGHAMYASGLVYIRGRWYLRVRNSWGEQWGLEGCCFMPESYFWYKRPGYPYLNLDAFAITAVRQDTRDNADLPDTDGE